MKHFNIFTKYARYSTKPNGRYDLAVIGGGSGGLACAKEAASLGKRVAVINYVKPSPRNTTWGLGGTCVNVGCIPKKLFHHAALLGESLQHAREYGWQFDNKVQHNWEVLRTAVSNHIKSLNWGHRLQLKQKNVDFFNAEASFINPHAIKMKSKSGEEVLHTDHALIAVGGRPKYPENVRNIRKYAISSDDLFSLSKPPGKTLIIGGSYVALECASFLTELGFDTSVMIRSVCLRGFDQQMANILRSHLASCGTTFLNECVPLSVEKVDNEHLKVVWHNGEKDGQSGEFQTVMVATGREAETDALCLHNVGVKTYPDSKKILTHNEQTNVPNIYAVGDVLHARPELTPVAIKAGKLLAHRLFGNSSVTMDYDNVPTTVFTTLEYGCVGLSEDTAIELYNENAIEVYHAFYQPLEYTVPHKSSEHCYIKVISLCTPPQRVLGMHLIGPNAGEIIQGFATAIKCGLTMETLHQTVGIHPTVAEEVVKLNITKKSGLDPTVTGC